MDYINKCVLIRYIVSWTLLKVLDQCVGFWEISKLTLLLQPDRIIPRWHILIKIIPDPPLNSQKDILSLSYWTLLRRSSPHTHTHREWGLKLWQFIRESVTSSRDAGTTHGPEYSGSGSLNTDGAHTYSAYQHTLYYHCSNKHNFCCLSTRAWPTPALWLNQ